MKNLKILGGIVLCVISLNVTAQFAAPLNNQLTEKPFLFSDLPEKFTVSRLSLEKIFATSGTGVIKIPIGNNRYLDAVVFEKIQRNANLVTVNMRLPQYEQSLFTLSRTTTNNTSVTYVGRVINVRFGDALILKEETQQLYLVKEKQSLLLVE